MTRPPASTYRLQIRRGFDLHQAAELAAYVRDLGADWLYLSPLLTAEPGSDHGYDVVDHAAVDADRGGDAGLAHASSTAHELGLGVLVDIVPNHVGVATPSISAWWWDVLTHGRGSEHADAFDIDWDAADGKLRVPVLGDEAEPALSLVDGQLRYYDQCFPLAPGTADDAAAPQVVHARQHYELVNWRRADAELNYRRFFAINTLAGLRVEVPEVFAATHRQIVRWIATGLADGLRIDHPDGLADPGRYLDELAAATGGSYVVVEKILEGDEQLPSHWPVAGTTGYDALASIDRVFVDAAGEGPLDALDAELRGGPVDWSVLIHDTKRAVADGILRSEVLRLERELGMPGSADAVAELLACFPVYRSYLPLGAEHLERAAELALHHRPDLAAPIAAVLVLLADPAHRAAVRFQQTSGMVMAKGVEDCAFYRYTRLGSLTEVGADPSEFAIDVAELHRRNGVRQARWPASMTTLTTHDTKRSEDTRARINVLSEIPDEWAEALRRLRTLAPLGDGPLEHLLWQSIVGAWPATADRLHAYAEKAAREAGTSTSWTAPSAEFEARLHALVERSVSDPAVVEVLAAIHGRITMPGRINGLGAKLVQITSPGVPDVYQGSELWETSLVDPDNRRPVDFAARRRLLLELDRVALPPIDDSGAAKLLVTSRSLRLRRDHPELFGLYRPLDVHGANARHAIAFDRGGAITIATRLPVGLARAGGWGATSFVLAGREWIDVLTGRHLRGGATAVAEVLVDYPVALLAPAEVIGR
ncbi:MAG: treY [Ilumatobacteraceae bacterium]|nr:treY [Ilumatobacteraceae bacterium]